MRLSARAALLGFAVVVVLVVGVGVGRADLAAMIAPFVIAFAWGFATRPPRKPQVSVDVDGTGEAGRIVATSTIDTFGATSVLLRTTAEGYAPNVVRLAGDEDTVELAVMVARTGVHELFRVDALSEGFGGVVTSPSQLAGPVPVAVHPQRVPLRGLPLPFRLPGLTGTHTSRRIGDGFDVHDVHEFAPGDRMKRIDWRVSARRAYDPRTRRLGTLYARRTFATADATVMVVVDSRDDVGENVATWASGTDIPIDETTSLDVAREAAAAIALAYLDGGDRVGLDDLGRRRRPVPPAAGARHGERIIHRLVRVAPEGRATERRRSPQIPSGALVVLCSTFLDGEAVRMAREWRAHGHRVLAVSTLPKLRVEALSGEPLVALRYVLLERRLRLRDLTRRGVDVVDWIAQPAANLDALARARNGARR